MTYVNEATVLGTGIAFTVLGVLSVATRFAVRKWKKMGWAADDWLSLAALPFVVACNIVMIIGKYS